MTDDVGATVVETCNVACREVDYRQVLIFRFDSFVEVGDDLSLSERNRSAVTDVDAETFSAIEIFDKFVANDLFIVCGKVEFVEIHIVVSRFEEVFLESFALFDVDVVVAVFADKHYAVFPRGLLGVKLIAVFDDFVDVSRCFVFGGKRNATDGNAEVALEN